VFFFSFFEIILFKSSVAGTQTSKTANQSNK